MARRPTVLVVGPEAVGGTTLVTVLRSAGFAVETVYSQMQAYGRCLHDLPDVILCEAMAESAEGVILAESLSKHEGTRDIPLVFVTRLPEAEIRKHLTALGGGYFVLQPTSLEHLASDLSLLLIRRKRPDIRVSDPFRVIREHTVDGRAAAGSSSMESNAARPDASSAPGVAPARVSTAPPAPAPAASSAPTPRSSRQSNLHVQALLSQLEDPNSDLLPEALYEHDAHPSDLAHVDSSPAPSTRPAQIPTPSSGGASRAQSFVKQPPSPPAAAHAPHPAAAPADMLTPSTSTGQALESLYGPAELPPSRQSHDVGNGVVLSRQDLRELSRLVSALTTSCLQLRSLLDRLEQESER